MEHLTPLLLANGTDVLTWFASGADEVSAHRRYLNLINVFPVADGDTGTNLSTTLRAMVSVPSQTPSFGRTLKQLSRRAMENARGNSGIIFASYVNGLALEGEAYERVGIREFAKVASGAVRHLYSAVEHPQEGTLMSIIRDWAAFLSHNCERYRSFQELFEGAYHAATVSLEKTRTQLSVLRRNNVVDSGAAGFVRFLEGINRVITGGRIAVVPDNEAVRPLAADDAPSEYRYCTEALVEAGRDITADEIKGLLHPLGDSLIVSLQDRRLKAHIHTNAPEQVMERLLTVGALLEQKADDMHLQNRLRAVTGGVGLVTDSIADLPDEYLLQHGISVLPMGVLARDTAFLDKVTIRLPQLFRAMEDPDAYPTSSQPEPGRIRALLAARLETFDSLIVLSVASPLSGTYQALRQAAAELATPQKPITVLDTHVNSGAQGLLVYRAAELAAQGLPHAQIVREIESRIPRTKIYVCLNTLAYAVRGGRVPNTVGQVGMKLGMRPIMTLDAAGHGAAFGVAFSQAGLTRIIFRLVRRAMKRGGIEAYSIVHGDNLPLAMAYRDQLVRLTGREPAFLSEISSAVALHAGPGTVAVCFTTRKGEAS